MGKLNFQDIKVDREEERVEAKAPKKASIFATKIEPEAEVFAPKEEEHTSFVEAQYTEDRRAYQEPQVQHQPNYAQPRGYVQPQEAYGAPTPSYVQPKEAYNTGVVMQHNSPTPYYSNPVGVNRESSLTVYDDDDSDFITINLSALDVEAIELPKVMDEFGRISDKITAVEDRTGISVLPFELTGTSSLVAGLKDHKIIEIEGKKYSTSYKRIVNPQELDRVIGEVVAEASRILAESVSDPNCKTRHARVPLFCKKEYNGVVFPTLRLNEYETQLALGKLRNFRATVKARKGSGLELYLVTGDLS
ncbi:hypothetical protein [Clostridium perfringens]|uniref:hypothetical protein n=1 Tax=Clostridium perfringens TaxID=1502 RepID=UPI0024BC6A5D|nr:hypothetical protein [Clostridium perfringens]